jgi:hypothetical protein
MICTLGWAQNETVIKIHESRNLSWEYLKVKTSDTDSVDSSHEIPKFEEKETIIIIIFCYSPTHCIISD